MIYPRDFIGYGENTPDPKWPKEASIAIQFVVNYEEGGEKCLLHGDDCSESFLSEIIGAAEWQNKRHWNMESIYEYGARVGFWRLYRIFTEACIPVTVFGVATALARSPEQVSAMKEASWEVASHGLKWIDYSNSSNDQELIDMRKAIKTHTAVTGSKPQGWYLGRCSDQTVSLTSEFGNFRYISDSYSDELPYWYKTESATQLIIPYTLDVNDMRFVTAQGFNSGTQFYDYLKDSFDMLVQEGRSGAPKMMSVGLHCRLTGRPGRALALKKFISYISSFPDVWIAKRIDIAEHWHTHHKPTVNSIAPNRLQKSEFLKIFGNVFEHSSWIAERAFENEISPSMNTSKGMYSALVYQFRIASYTEKINVILSHPNLAGKLLQSNSITNESLNEQQSAGLNNLSSSEIQQFLNLNEKYQQKFNHPFIMAVANSTKATILSAFNRRIENSKEIEFEIACKEIEKIARIRIDGIFSQN